MCVLNKSLASGHPVAGRLPAAPNTDDWRALSEPPSFSHGPGSPETTQPAENGCRCIPSILFCSYGSRKILPGEALCRMGLLPRKAGERLRIGPRTVIHSCRSEAGRSFLWRVTSYFINTWGFVGHAVSVTATHSVFVARKQPHMLCRWMDMAGFQ